MKFLLDQDVPEDVVFSLEALQHEVLKLRDLKSASTPDEQVLAIARQRDCVLITCNRDDFLDLAQHSDHPGIIILIRRRTRALERAALVKLLDKAGEAGIRHNVNFA